MHDLSLCRSIATSVREAAEGRPVRMVYLEIGQLRHIDPDHFVETWAAACVDTDLADTELMIEIVPLTLTCSACSARTEIADAALRCGACGSTEVEIVGGDAVTVVSIDTAS